MQDTNTATINDQLQHALTFHQQGQLEQAELGYKQLLDDEPHHPDVLQLYGTLLYQKGDIPHAEVLLKKAIDINPKLAEAHCNLGNIHFDQGNYDEALKAYERAIEANPEMFQAHTNKGNIHRARGNLQAAEQCYRTALQINPEYADALYQLGELRRDQRRWNEALEAYRKATALIPGFAMAHAGIGRVFLSLNRPGDAIPAFYHALTNQPALFDGHFGIGEAFFQQRRLSDAITAYHHALNLKPDSVELLDNLGNVYNEMGDYKNAEDCFQKALALDPDSANSWNNLGNNLQYCGKHEEALKAFQKAAELDPTKVEALNNVGQSLIHLSQPNAAIPPLKQALEIEPQSIPANYNYAYALHLSGHHQDAYPIFRSLIERAPDMHLIHDTLLMCLSYDHALTPEEIFEEHLDWARRHEVPRQKLIKPLTNQPDPDRKLKIGYVSTDLGRHSVGHMTRSTITAHNKDAFEVYYYSGRALEDDITERFKESADGWRSTLGMSETALADQIRTDGIDILIDLNGHTAGSRLTVFAQKPAPVQVTWIGYCDTSGLESVDYILMDPMTTPPELDHLFSETVIRLPETRFCFSPPEYAPPVSQLPALTNGYITFASFNNLQKVNETVIDAWSQILHRVPNSKLIINWKTLREPQRCEKLASEFAQRGISANRLDLRQGASSGAGVLGEYSEVDIALDTFPYSGGITTSEALWMGVPVVSLLGDRAVARQSASIITAAGEPETVATTVDQYIDIAAHLAGDLGKLYADRKTRRQRMETSPLCDAKRFLPHLESAYREMWKTWCATQNQK